MKGDPIERKLHNERIDRFHCLIKRGTKIEVNEGITTIFTPLSPLQTRVCFKIYYTKEYDAKYCDESGMNLLGKFSIELHGSGLDKLRFGFTFGQMEIAATAANEATGQRYKTTFNLTSSELL